MCGEVSPTRAVWGYEADATCVAAKHTDVDSWEFVFIQFSSIDVAWRVKAMLEEKFPETLRVRFSGQ